MSADGRRLVVAAWVEILFGLALSVAPLVADSLGLLAATGVGIAVLIALFTVLRPNSLLRRLVAVLTAIYLIPGGVYGLGVAYFADDLSFRLTTGLVGMLALVASLTLLHATSGRARR